jgi:hypothetical protein
MDTTQPNLAPRCNHIADNGRRCGSPALRSRDFCYYHQRIHHPMPHPRKNPAAFIPPLESAAAISLAATNIARAVGTGILDERQARTMIAAIRQIRWAFDYASNRGSSVTDVPEAMSKVLTLAHTEIEPTANEESSTEESSTRQCATEELGTEKRATDIPAAERPEAAPCHLPLKPTKGFCPSPLINYPPNASLDPNQLAYCRFVINYGFMHPEYDDAHRRLAAYIATGAAS